MRNDPVQIFGIVKEDVCSAVIIIDTAAVEKIVAGHDDYHRITLIFIVVFQQITAVMDIALIAFKNLFGNQPCTDIAV